MNLVHISDYESTKYRLLFHFLTSAWMRSPEFLCSCPEKNILFCFTARDAPYAKARTTFVRDVQLARNVLANHFSRPAPSYTDTTPLNPH